MYLFHQTEKKFKLFFSTVLTGIINLLVVIEVLRVEQVLVRGDAQIGGAGDAKQH